MIPALLLLLSVFPARASCGLDHCPAEAAPTGERFVLRSTTRHTAAPGGAAWYAQQYVGGHVQVGPARVGGSMPVVYVRDAFGPWVGPGNGLVFGEAGTLDGRLGAGVQVELPTSTRSADAGHWVLLPYARSQLRLGQADLRTRLGWVRALGADTHTHGTDLPAVEVDPHTDSELVLRVEPGVSVDMGAARVRPAVGATGIQPLTQAGTVVQAGAALALDLRRVRLRLDAEAPLTQTRRFDFRAGLSLSYLHPE